VGLGVGEQGLCGGCFLLFWVSLFLPQSHHAWLLRVCLPTVQAAQPPRSNLHISPRAQVALHLDVQHRTALVTKMIKVEISSVKDHSQRTLRVPGGP